MRFAAFERSSGAAPDPALIERILASVKGNWTPQTAVHLRLYLVAERLRIAPKLEF
jgi:hypothetical protein